MSWTEKWFTIVKAIKDSEKYQWKRRLMKLLCIVTIKHINWMHKYNFTLLRSKEVIIKNMNEEKGSNNVVITVKNINWKHKYNFYCIDQVWMKRRIVTM